jgi:hypothetical protein
MKFSLMLSSLLVSTALMAAQGQPRLMPVKNACACDAPTTQSKTCECSENSNVLTPDYDLRIYVTGQGVAPCDDVCSPAQAYALAKRSAITDSYRLIAERVKGVYVEGEDYIKNMMVKRTTVRTSVNAMVRNANIIETTFKDGLCEVEMEIVLSRSNF